LHFRPEFARLIDFQEKALDQFLFGMAVEGLMILQKTSRIRH